MEPVGRTRKRVVAAGPVAAAKSPQMQGHWDSAVEEPPMNAKFEEPLLRGVTSSRHWLEAVVESW